MNAQDKIAVIQAQEDGKKIQFRARTSTETGHRDYLHMENALRYGHGWHEKEDERLSGPYVFDFSHYDYRVKPEPREFYIGEPVNLSNAYYSPGLFRIAYTKEQADSRCLGGSGALIKALEVI